jgi:hypothetical protein
MAEDQTEPCEEGAEQPTERRKVKAGRGKGRGKPSPVDPQGSRASLRSRSERQGRRGRAEEAGDQGGAGSGQARAQRGRRGQQQAESSRGRDERRRQDARGKRDGQGSGRAGRTPRTVSATVRPPTTQPEIKPGRPSGGKGAGPNDPEWVDSQTGEAGYKLVIGDLEPSTTALEVPVSTNILSYLICCFPFFRFASTLRFRGQAYVCTSAAQPRRPGPEVDRLVGRLLRLRHRGQGREQGGQRGRPVRHHPDRRRPGQGAL